MDKQPSQSAPSAGKQSNRPKQVASDYYNGPGAGELSYDSAVRHPRGHGNPLGYTMLDGTISYNP